jgi:uncharacterized membrane protein (UPF0182 family)
VSHVRYPEDLFKLQRDVLTRYHVSDAGDFYNQNDRWQIPSDPTRETDQAQPPYYILSQRPGDSGATFQLTSALNAFNRENLSAFISASADPATYGELQVLRLPGNTPYQGPSQVQNAMTSNESVASNLNILRQGSNVQFGNLLTLPIGDAGLLYVEPVYVQSRSNNGFPLLQKVIVNYQGKIGYGDSLAQGLDQVFGAGTGDSAADGGSTGGSTSPPTTSAPTTTAPPSGGGGDVVVDSATAQAIAAIQQALQDLATAQQSGNFAAVGTAQQALADASRAFEAAQSSASASASSAPASPTG